MRFMRGRMPCVLKNAWVNETHCTMCLVHVCTTRQWLGKVSSCMCANQSSTHVARSTPGGFRHSSSHAARQLQHSFTA
jgi:hypothetical protein